MFNFSDFKFLIGLDYFKQPQPDWLWAVPGLNKALRVAHTEGREYVSSEHPKLTTKPPPLVIDNSSNYDRRHVILILESKV